MGRFSPRLWLVAPAAALVLTLTGCAGLPPAEHRPSNVNEDAVLTPTTRITRDLVRLPPPRFKVPVAVYGFRDQTGQFKPQPDSNLSNAVTQGAASILVKALLDSGWYLPIEREGFQNLLTERRVAKALEAPTDKGKPGSSYPPLMAANFLIEGGIIGYESNVRTGGGGAALLGVGSETKYRVDQVTVNLRSVDVRSGQVINSVSVTKTIFSREVSAHVYRFVSYKTLLQAEGGFSTNEPTQLAVKEAIEAAVIHLTIQGMRDGAWALRDERDWQSPLVQAYLHDAELNLAGEVMPVGSQVPEKTVDMGPSTLMLPPMAPLPITPKLAASPPAAPPAVSAPSVPAASVPPPTAAAMPPHLPPQTQPANPPAPLGPLPAPTPALAPAAVPVPAMGERAQLDGPHRAPVEGTLAEEGVSDVLLQAAR